MTHGSARGIASSPALARAGVRGVSIGTQRATIDPSIGDGVDDLLTGASQHRRYDGSGGNAYQDDVIQSHTVEAVLEGEYTLDLVCLDHAGQHVAHRRRSLSLHHSLAGKVVGHGQNPAEVVGRVTPLSRQPGVIEVEPADHRADVEGRLHGIQLVGSAGDARATGHDSARDDGSHELGAGRVLQCLKAAGERIHQAVAGGLVRLGARDLEALGVISDGDQRGIRGGAFG